MRVLVAGATGAIGRPLVRQLLAAGHEVVGLSRDAERAAALSASGATGVVCDALDRTRLESVAAQARPDAVIHQLTSIPDRINPRRLRSQFAATNRLRDEGTRNLVAAARTAGAKQFIAQSIAFAYDAGEDLRVETDPFPTDPPPSARPLLAALQSLEGTTLAATDLAAVVLRYGYFYGPGTIYASDGSFAEDVRKRRMPLIGAGAGVFSFIHVEDAATATVAALGRTATGVFNIVDDHPVAVAEWLPTYAKLLGAPRPMTVPRLIARLLAGPYAVHMMCAQSGASNAKARAELQWHPGRASWREGFEELRS